MDNEKYSWWNFSCIKNYPENHFQIACDIGWKHPKFVAFSLEDAKFLCLLLNNKQKEEIMPDITKCTNKECKSKEKCYRYMSKANNRQSYEFFNLYREDKCAYFIPAIKKEKKDE